MKLTRYLSLSLGLLMAAAAMQGLASPVSPKLPSTLNFQSLNEITVPPTEAEWTFEMSRLDMSICSQHITGLRARSSDMYCLQYMLLHTVLTSDSTELSALASYASSNGYDVETAFLHYYDDTSVTYANGTTETIKGYGGGTAATLTDARVKGYIWTSGRYIYNLKSPLFQKFKGYYYRKIVTSSPYPDGIFVDETSPAAAYFPTINSGGHVVEYSNQTHSQFSSAYLTDTTAAFATVNSMMGNDSANYPGGDRILLPNVAEYVCTFMDIGINGADGLLTEAWMQAVQPRVLDACNQAKQLADAGKILIYAQGTSDPEISAPSNYFSAVDRHQMFSLSNYWLARQGRYTYYEQKAPTGSPSLSQFWCKAREYDIGSPVDPLYTTWQTGTDSAGQNYTIYKRAYTKGLIISRPKVGWTYSDFATQSQQYDLGGAYQLLHYDGTLGPPISKIGLAMGEAVTLVGTTAPPPPDTTPPTISGVAAGSITANSATITWSTNEPATGSVDYGTSTSYGSSGPASSLLSSQSVTLTGLTAGTAYHYRVNAKDAAGNAAQSTDYTFTTASSGGGGGTTPVGFIKRWALIGTFGRGHDTDFIGETTVHPSAGDATAGLTWTDYTSPSDQMDLCAVYAQNQNVTAYLNTYVYSPTQRSAQVRIGVDDAAKVFLNGALVINDTGYRSANADTDIANVTLNAGWNQLLIKAENFTVGWTLFARITDTQGNVFGDLSYQLNNPTTSAGTPKMGVAISADKSTVRVGDQITYTVTYANTGDGSATNAVVSAGVDSHVTFISATGGGSYDSAARVVRWNVGTVAPGASAAVSYAVTVN